MAVIGLGGAGRDHGKKERVKEKEDRENRISPLE